MCTLYTCLDILTNLQITGDKNKHTQTWIIMSDKWATDRYFTVHC